MHDIHLQCTQVYKRIKDHICPSVMSLGKLHPEQTLSVAVQERLTCCEPKLQENKEVLSYFSARVRFKLSYTTLKHTN